MFVDILVIADDIITNVRIPGVEWVFLPEGQGLTDMQRRLAAGEWHKEGIKILILIMGQAEAVAEHQAMTNVVQSVMNVVHAAYPGAVILLCAPLPHPRDGPLVIGDLRELADAMHEVCKEQSYYEYSWLGAFFYGRFKVLESTWTVSGSLVPVYLIRESLMDRESLTLEGISVVQSHIKDKIKQAGLYECHLMLSSTLISFAL